MAESSKLIEIHEPASSHPSLADGPGGFDRAWFMGKWGVAWSTLPMWKAGRGKKNVTILYTPLKGEQSGSLTDFESCVSSLKEGQAEDASPSSIRGVETLSPNANGATFDWRGRNMLYLIHSHWEVLGYGKEDGLEWAVTFFSKTLFTPAGMDIYVRSAPAASPQDQTPRATPEQKKRLVGRVVEALGKTDAVKNLAAGGFECPGVLSGLRCWSSLEK